MNRMNHSQLMQYLVNENYVALAMDFSDCDQTWIEDGLIDADFVKRHLVIGPETERSTRLWREIQANVTTYIGCDK